ncbi:MAG: hypothetical protein JW913_09320 [Chitinispirillaceae bacterium]|nr:hypothetical protein [Chitinispirillaceae bacterium]
MVQFISEHINFLWIIPAVAFGFFIFLIQFITQKNEERSDLSKEVARFNTGTPAAAFPAAEQGADRLNQLERAISTVTESLSAQQRTIEQFHRDNTAYNGEINELKSKLRELYKEYDIVLSENYSLRAKVKKLQGGRDNAGGDAEESTAPPQLPPPEAPPLPPFSSKVDMKLYEDTRTLNLALLDDTSEIDISDLTKRSDLQ